MKKINLYQKAFSSKGPKKNFGKSQKKLVEKTNPIKSYPQKITGETKWSKF